MVIKMGEMDINIEERVQKAVDLFKSGYNCSQSVFLAYNDLFAIEDTLLVFLIIARVFYQLHWVEVWDV